MKKYSIKSTGSKSYTILLADKAIGYLNYKGWLSLKADIISLTHGTTYPIEPEGFWGTTIIIKNEEAVLLSYKMNWRGMIIIKTKSDSIEREFIFKQRGFFHSVYVLLDKEGQKLLTVYPEFKWRKLNSQYTISATDLLDNLSFAEILLFTALHCTRYYSYMMAAAV